MTQARGLAQAEITPGRNAAPVQHRLIQRCVIDFLMNQVSRMSRRHQGDIVGAAVFLAIKQATTSTPRAGLALSDLPVRAVSVRAVAQSLGFSYETTRRRVIALETAGLITRLGDAGVAITPDALERNGYRRDTAAVHQDVRQLYANLAQLDSPVGAPGREPSLTGDDLDLAVASHCDDFTLRVVEIGALPHASTLNGLIFAGFMIANASRITYDYELARRYGAASTPPPDAVRRPATITEVAKRLHLPHEVVRRRVLTLMDKGYVRRITGGYLVTIEVLQSPKMLESGMLINQRFMQLTQALASLGVDTNGVG